MRTAVEPVPRSRIWDLISTNEFGEISEAQRTNLRQWIDVTTVMWGGFIDGELVCVFGVVPPTMLSNRAYLWLWETDKVEGREFLFIRKSQLVIKELLKQFHSLHGVCKAEAKQSQRWIRLLGGKFGKRNGDFIPFVIEAD